MPSSLAHVLVERDQLDYDMRVLDVWPEFGADGKNKVTLRHVLLHTAGVPELPSDTTVANLCDWEHMCEVIAAEEPRCRGYRRPDREPVLATSGACASQTRSDSLDGNRAELFHLREDVHDSPCLGDPAACEAADEDLVVDDGFAGWGEAHVFT
jgi:hypothetical protein